MTTAIHIQSAETEEDMQKLRPLFRKFHALARLPGEYDCTVEGRLAELVRTGTGFVFFAGPDPAIPTGVLGGVIIADLFTQTKYAQELFWYTDPETPTGIGAALLAAYESMARASGAAIARLTSLAHLRADAVARVYGRRGYILRETHFEKEL